MSQTCLLTANTMSVAGMLDSTQFPRWPIMTTGDDDDDTMMMCTAHQLGIEQPNFQLLQVAPTGDQISNYMQE